MADCPGRMWATLRASSIGSCGPIFTNLFVVAMEEIRKILAEIDRDMTDAEFEAVKERVYAELDKLGGN